MKNEVSSPQRRRRVIIVSLRNLYSSRLCGELLICKKSFDDFVNRIYCDWMI